MAAVLISYDLHKPNQNYKDLIDAIQGLGDWWHFLESTWLVATTATPDAVQRSLSAALDSNDSVLILNITGDSYQGYLPDEAWDWIRRYV